MLTCFDEDAYLEFNPDIKRAVESGTFQSGKAHYRRYGYQEHRRPYNVSSRKDKLLFYIDKHLKGLEIGPSYSPIAPKEKGSTSKRWIILIEITLLKNT